MRADGEMLILDVKRFWRGRYREPTSGATTCGLAAGQENSERHPCSDGGEIPQEIESKFRRGFQPRVFVWSHTRMPSGRADENTPPSMPPTAAGFSFARKPRGLFFSNVGGGRG